MKRLILGFGVFCAAVALMLPAQASTINPIISADDHTVNELVDIDISYAFSLDGADIGVAIDFVEVFFGDGDFLPNEPWPVVLGSPAPNHVVQHVYGKAESGLTITAILHGYFFTKDGAQTHFEAGNGSYININGFTGVTPIPAALPLFLTALGGLGYLGLRRRKAAQLPV